MKKYFFLAISLFIFSANEALACACGCGVFSVGTSSLIPNEAGGTAFLQYDYINQNRNWYGRDRSSSDNNGDKQIKSQVVTAGMQYMFNRKWGAAIRIPYMHRVVKMADVGEDGDVMMKMGKVNSVGDVRINGIYSGFFDDMSTGITFGLKLPTGQSSAKAFDSRDMQIGTGSTDSLLGAYHLGTISKEARLSWFAQGNWQHALITHLNYHPGDEISAATGISYNAGSFVGIKRVVPIIQVLGSRKSHDGGSASNPANTGYVHGYFAPALELTFGKFRTYADIELPFYQKTRGYQLVPSRIYELILSYSF